MFNSGVRLVGREVGPSGGWPPPDQAAAHATLAPDQNPPVQLVQLVQPVQLVQLVQHVQLV